MFNDVAHHQCKHAHTHFSYLTIRPRPTVSCKRVSGLIKADKTCHGLAVIVIHYSFILPQHFLYNLKISYSCLDKHSNCTEHGQCIHDTFKKNGQHNVF